MRRPVGSPPCAAKEKSSATRRFAVSTPSRGSQAACRGPLGQPQVVVAVPGALPRGHRGARRVQELRAELPHRVKQLVALVTAGARAGGTVIGHVSGGGTWVRHRGGQLDDRLVGE